MDNSELSDFVYLGQKGYTIPKNKLSEEEITKIRNDLIIKPYIPGMLMKNVNSYLLFRESPKKLYVPRLYGVNNICQYKESRIGDGDNIDIDFKGNLREYQKKIVNAYLEESERSGCGLLEIYAGAGKTVMALKIIGELKKKTLIIVHKEFLMSQWIERIEQFIPNARIGKIQGNTFDIEGKDIVLGMLQSLSMRDYEEKQFNTFGMTIVDECFNYNTKVLTSIGYVKIGALYDSWMMYNKAPNVYSYNMKTKCFEYKKLTYAWKKNTDRMVCLRFKDGNHIECTNNHKILTSSGYKKARYLKENDIVLCYSITPSLHYCKVLNNDQLQVIIGSWISNHCLIDKLTERTYRVNFYSRKKDYISFKQKVFGIDNYNYVESTKYYSFDSFPFHFENGFDYSCIHDVKILINKMDLKGFAVWIMEKGYYNKERNELFLSLGKLPEEVVEEVVEKFSLYLSGVEIDKSVNGNYLIFNEIQTHKLLNVLDSYIVQESYFYEKFKYICNKSSSYLWKYKDTRVASLLIYDIERDSKCENVYDIEVRDNHNYIVQLKERNGLIVHNCHHIGAEVFCRALFKVVTKYMLGLSATMTRKDGLSKVFKMFLGDIVYRYKRQGDDNVVVKVIQYKNSDPEFNEEVFNYRGQVHYSVMIKKICEFNHRTEFIIKLICDYINEESNEYERDTKEDITTSQIMVLAHNKSILKYMYDAINTRKLASVGYYLGGMKEKELKKTEDKKIVIATYAMAEEALDIKTLSCLFLTSPRTDVTQAVGRILRVKHKQPVVYDIVDQHPIFQRQFIKRRTSYIKWKYKVIETDNHKYLNNEWITIYNTDGNEKIYKRNIKNGESEFQGKCILKVKL